MHFLGITWHDSAQHPSFLLSAQPNSGERIVQTITASTPFSMSFSGKKYCIGCHTTCPDNVDLSTSQDSQCATCRAGDSTYYLSLSGLAHEQVEHLKTVHHFNYLTVFGDGILKTGVAAVNRKYKRILEQGATAALYFTECDGYTARQIERYVSYNLKIKQALSWDTKAGLLLKHADIETMRAKVESMYSNIVTLLPTEYKSYLKQPPEFFQNEQLIQAKRSGPTENFTYVTQVRAGDTVSGTICGTYGSTLLLKNDDGHLLLNTNTCKGSIVTMSTDMLPMHLSVEPKKIEREEVKNEVLTLF